MTIIASRRDDLPPQVRLSDGRLRETTILTPRRQSRQALDCRATYEQVKLAADGGRAMPAMSPAAR